MDDTPNTPEALSQHFSRRASAARIALRKQKRTAPRNVLPKTPLEKLRH